MFAQRLRELRTSKNLSQQDIADLVGKTQQAVNLWEKGDNEPSHDILKKLADFFSVTVDYLLGHEGRVSPAHAGQEGNVLLKVGVKEIPIFSVNPENRDEFYAKTNIIGYVPICGYYGRLCYQYER